MSYFPFFMEIAGKPCLIVGGGRVAFRKMEKLLPFGAEITVVSPAFCPEIAEMAGIRRIQRAFQPEDIAGMQFVIGAADEVAVNQEIAALCRARQIPVNIVDAPADCSFFFPALLKRGDLVVGISTGGASPLAAQYLRKEVERVVPAHFEEMIAYLAALRPLLRERMPDAKERETFLRKVFALLLEKEGDAEEEIKKLLEDKRK